MPSDQDRRCRVCGLLQVDPPWGEDGESPSFDVCPCCGVEFGYEDTLVVAAKAYRAQWLKKGAPWFLPDEQPPDWNLDQQLALIPEPFR